MFSELIFLKIRDKLRYLLIELRLKLIMNKKNYNRIKVVLAEKGKTNLWLAEALNVNKTTVSRWCTNDIQPNTENLFAIAKVLKIDVRELLISTKK